LVCTAVIGTAIILILLSDPIHANASIFGAFNNLIKAERNQAAAEQAVKDACNDNRNTLEQTKSILDVPGGNFSAYVADYNARCSNYTGWMIP